MIEPGRVIVKIAGKEKGKVGVIIKKIDDNFVIINGEMKERKCNIRHLEPLPYKISNYTSKESIIEELKKLNLIKEKKKREKKK